MHIIKMDVDIPGIELGDRPGRLAPVSQELEMGMNAPTQHAHSLCSEKQDLQRKCSFLRAGFHLNGAFQLNSLKLLTPPQNESVSEREFGILPFC